MVVQLSKFQMFTFVELSGGSNVRDGDDCNATAATSSSQQSKDQNEMYVLAGEDGALPKQPLASTPGINQSFSSTDGVDIFGNALPRSAVGTVRRISGMVVKDPRFQGTVVALIIINSITMGIGTFDFVTENPRVDTAFDRIDKAFLIIFTVELGFQFVYHGVYFFKDGWLVFDFLVVFLSYMFASVQVIRAFRIIRALRLITRIKDLKDLATALLSVIPKMIAVFGLLLLVFYIFAVMFTQLFKGLYEDGVTSEDYFSRLDKSLFTLFQMMTLDSWSAITKEVMQVYTWAWILFFSFVSITSFIIINLVIAVICDAVASIHRESEKDIQDIKSATEPIKSTPEDVARLEKKIDDLTNTVQMLLLSQQQLQDAFQLRQGTETIHVDMTGTDLSED